ncbi:DUF2948 family protein [Nereida sp. MMG025]|uniref:DUF2948 family protein n=1 Tax=Nereida sp. MMG025 TaxID=2909981 RepID=UPI001F3059A9|nr:DUF2948 family protein [Nereida sp. MMG025]MCF6443972.1 DUF2948 family protein [Nereida sp. MMG025]
MSDTPTDASFVDGGERPLRLIARDGDDVQVVSALLQDAVFPATEMKWDAGRRRFALLLNRFRWEDVPAAERRGRAFERVQALLIIDDVLRVASQGIDPKQSDMILSLLSIDWDETEAPGGTLTLHLAGDGAIALHVDAIEMTLKDVTRPYIAPSAKQPKHPE